ncbi:hypothetical protein [Kitasatospora azatica]|uniref:hypothetical protein n=1 Tax=Kitasatospora azatica TaxID=58347 RepID=UPI00055C276B|nr:hypothetical protein [Kitasatospora azatica]
MTADSAPYCEPADVDPLQALTPAEDAGGPRADCVLCGEPTEYPAGTAGATLCAVCAWQQAGRIACSG